MRVNKNIVMLLAGFYLFLACASTLAGASVLQIKNQWVREAPPMASMLAGYLQVENTTDSEIVLVDVTSSEFQKVEIHRTEMLGGIARMVRHKRIAIPANGSFSFEPAGYHLMLMRPTAPLRAGDTVNLKLELEGKQSVDVIVPVKRSEVLTN